jgi:hypothetical protein
MFSCLIDLTFQYQKRLTHIIEEELSYFQSEFRQNRSTTDNIFMIRQIVEKCYEHNIDIHNMFIDDAHAFDLVKRNKIIECLFQYCIPVKLIRLIKLTFEKTRAKVKVNNKFTEEFQV